jgi:hypothetical protein
VPPGQHERVLDRVLGAIRIAEDEVGDAMQPREGSPHQLGIGFVIAVPGRDDQVSLHPRHHFGAGHLPVLTP